MKNSSSLVSDAHLQELIDRSLKGDSTAHEAMIQFACDRLMFLTRQMFHTQANDLRRWEQTDDIFQNAMIRLHPALAAKPVESVRHFYNLAAMQIRRELIDLGRHHFGPLGDGANHHTDHQPADNQGGELHEKTDEAEEINDWADFHEYVEQLPADERETVNLIYYEGLSLEESARLLGISLSTVKRRWQSARLRISEALARERER